MSDGVICYVCTVYDVSSSTCTTAEWQECPSVLGSLPSVAYAEAVGWAVLTGWVTVAALKYLLKPRKDSSDE